MAIPEKRFPLRGVRDTSWKIRAVQKAKAERGERLGSLSPYGYVKGPETKKLIIGEEAAAIIHCAAGMEEQTLPHKDE